MVLPLVIAVIALGGNNDSEVPCDTSSERLVGIVHEATNLRDDPVWERNRKEWGWTGREQITEVTDARICKKAAAALVHDGYADARTRVAVVGVGKGYIAQPGDDSDLWIVLDSQFRVLARMIVPS
jgi:hypothetical protein